MKNVSCLAGTIRLGWQRTAPADASYALILASKPLNEMKSVIPNVVQIGAIQNNANIVLHASHAYGTNILIACAART